MGFTGALPQAPQPGDLNPFGRQATQRLGTPPPHGLLGCAPRGVVVGSDRREGELSAEAGDAFGGYSGAAEVEKLEMLERRQFAQAGVADDGVAEVEVLE